MLTFSKIYPATAAPADIEREFNFLAILHRAGAPVPRPVAVRGRTLRMERIGSAATLAPCLADVDLEKTAAPAMWAQITAAVAAMWANGVLHCDLYPRNLLNHDGRIVVVDFGSAKFVDELANPAHQLHADLSHAAHKFRVAGFAINPRAVARAISEQKTPSSGIFRQKEHWPITAVRTAVATSHTFCPESLTQEEQSC